MTWSTCSGCTLARFNASTAVFVPSCTASVVAKEPPKAVNAVRAPSTIYTFFIIPSPLPVLFYNLFGDNPLDDFGRSRINGCYRNIAVSSCDFVFLHITVTAVPLQTFGYDSLGHFTDPPLGHRYFLHDILSCNMFGN